MPGAGFLEKRQFERISARIPVRYMAVDLAEAERLAASNSYVDLTQPLAAAGKTKNVMQLVTENISVGGLMLVGDQAFQEGQTVAVELRVPPSPEPLRALAVVVRNMPSSAGKFTAGVKFMALNKADVARLERYVQLMKVQPQA